MIQTFIKYLSFEKRYSDHTIKAYHKDLNQLEYFLKDQFELQEIHNARHEHLRSWIVFLSERNISSLSINRKIATLKSFYKFLLGRAYIHSNPASNLRPLKSEKKLPSFLKEEETVALLDQVEFKDDFEGKRDRLMLELFYATGIRLAELSGLKDRDVNFYEKSIKVIGKRSKERIIPVQESLILIIEDYIKAKHAVGYQHECLILTDTGKPVYPMFIQRKVTHYLQSVTTLKKKSPHLLRHTFATHLLNKGADLNAVKDLLGHASLAATQVYTHNSIEKLKEAFNQAHPKA